MELPASGTLLASGTWVLMKSSVILPASASETSDASMAASRPLLVCMLRTKSSMAAIASGGWWTTRSGPSATISRSSSVTSVAISTIVCVAGSSPVISRSIHTSTGPASLRSPVVALTVPLLHLDADLAVPAYAKEGDAGADLVARESQVLSAGGGRALIPTGVAIAIPDGYAGFVLPRSGLALRYGVTCLNTPGLIDAGYRDELKVLLVNTDPKDDYKVQRGDRIAQLVIMRVDQAAFSAVDELSPSERGTGGFGHSGR